MKKIITCRDVRIATEKVYGLDLRAQKRCRPSSEACFIYAKACKNFAEDFHETTVGKEIRRHRTSVIYYLIQAEDLWHLPTFRNHVSNYYTIIRILRDKMDSKKPASYDRSRTNKATL